MPNQVPTDQLTLTFNDFSKEKSASGINVKQLTDNAAYTTARDDYITATTDITTGTHAQTLELLVTRLSNAFPTDSASQREEKLLIRYEDDVTFQVYTVTIPTLDKSAVTFVTNSDFVELDDSGNMAAWVTAFEALASSPNGNAVTVLDAKYVGRNS